MTGKKTVVDTLRFLAEIGLKQFEAEPFERVVPTLLTKAEPVINRDGCRWFTHISWPDRVPELKTWAGRVTLHGLIGKLQKALRGGRIESGEDLLRFEAPIKGVSGFDHAAAADPIDIGFSPAALDMPIIQKPGQELLAVYAMECLSLVSSSHPTRRMCGFLWEGSVYEMEVQPRAGGCYFRWGPLTVHGAETY